MIKLRVPIEDLDNTVISPVVISVLNELKKVLFLSTDSHLVIENKETEYFNKNWKVGNTTNKEINGPTIQKILVSYDITYDEQNIITTTARKNRTKHILLDKVTGMNVKSLYLETILNLKFKIKDKSKITVNNTLNRLKLRYISNRDAFYHSAVYYYYIPEFISVLINNLVYLKNHILVTEETFEEYVTNLIDDRFTLISNLSGEIPSMDLAFKEVQNGIIGYFKSDLLNPEKTYNKDTGYWECELEYEVRFDQPMFYDIEYPTVAYQYQLDKSFTTLLTTTNSANKFGDIDGYTYFLNKYNTTDTLASIMASIRYDSSYLRIPESDVHSDILPRELYTRIFSVQTTINKDDKRCLFNLKDMGNIELTDKILSFLENGEYEYVTDTLSSFIQLELYENDIKMSDDILGVDKFLNVCTTRDLELTKNYRVFFNVVPQINALTIDGKRRALDNRDILDTVTNIIKIQTDILNTNSNLIRNLDIKFKLIENDEMRIKYYSYIIACVLTKKDECNDRL